MSTPTLSPPQTNPLGIFPQFIAPRTSTILLREHLFSATGDSFSINLLENGHEGQPLLTCEGKVMSLSKRKRISDPRTGEHLFDIRQDIARFGPKSFYCEGPGGETFFEIKGEWSLNPNKSTAQFHSPFTKSLVSLSIKGDFFGDTASIVDTASGQTVAYIDRHWGARDSLGGKQTYTLTVAENVDMALMVAMCICADERREK